MNRIKLWIELTTASLWFSVLCESLASYPGSGPGHKDCESYTVTTADITFRGQVFYDKLPPSSLASHTLQSSGLKGAACDYHEWEAGLALV